MTLLGIDTSTPASAACVMRDDGESFEVAPEPARLAAGPAHARELMPAITDAMEQTDELITVTEQMLHAGAPVG